MADSDKNSGTELADNRVSDNRMSCGYAGSNFVLRSRYAQEVGWFPTYTMCEDFALALELQAKKRKAAYVREFLAMGEVPTTVRGCFQQRSRYALSADVCV